MRSFSEVRQFHCQLLRKGYGPRVPANANESRTRDRRKGPQERDYWQKVPRFENVLPNFETPQPVEQSILYKTAEEIVDPVLAQSSGKIPNWLKGKFESKTTIIQ